MAKRKNKPPADTLVEMRSTDQRMSHLSEILKDIPKDLLENLPLILNRLNVFTAFYTTANLARLDRLTNFLTLSEEVLFDEKNILALDHEALRDLYKIARTSSIEILEMSRKVAAQVVPDETDKQVDEVYRMLQGLSPDTLKELKVMLSEPDEETVVVPSKAEKVKAEKVKAAKVKAAKVKAVATNKTPKKE